MNASGLRKNSRRLGITFQVLSVLTIIWTIYWTIKVYNLGSQFGISTFSNTFSGSFFLFGMFSGLMLTGFGHALGMLCAIYDRQELQQRQVAVVPTQPASPSRDWRQQTMSRPPVWESPPANESGGGVNPDVAPPVTKSD